MDGLESGCRNNKEAGCRQEDHRRADLVTVKNCVVRYSAHPGIIAPACNGGVGTHDLSTSTNRRRALSSVFCRVFPGWSGRRTGYLHNRDSAPSGIGRERAIGCATGHFVCFRGRRSGLVEGCVHAGLEPPDQNRVDNLGRVGGESPPSPPDHGVPYYGSTGRTSRDYVEQF